MIQSQAMWSMALLHREAHHKDPRSARLRLQCVQVQIVLGWASKCLLQLRRKNVDQSERDKRGREEFQRWYNFSLVV